VKLARATGLPHFQHLASGGDYYSYMWSSAPDAFAETGDPFNSATAKRPRRFIYGAGSLRNLAAWPPPRT
jgi:peptidyl-dipeptidase Dcp